MRSDSGDQDLAALDFAKNPDHRQSVHFPIGSGEHDDRNTHEGLVPAHDVEQFDAGHPWQVQVEHDHRRLLSGGEDIERRATVGCFGDVEAIVREQIPDRTARVLVIFDDENRRAFGM